MRNDEYDGLLTLERANRNGFGRSRGDRYAFRNRLRKILMVGLPLRPVGACKTELLQFRLVLWKSIYNLKISWRERDFIHPVLNVVLDLRCIERNRAEHLLVCAKHGLVGPVQESTVSH